MYVRYIPPARVIMRLCAKFSLKPGNFVLHSKYYIYTHIFRLFDSFLRTIHQIHFIPVVGALTKTLQPTNTTSLLKAITCTELKHCTITVYTEHIGPSLDLFENLDN